LQAVRWPAALSCSKSGMGEEAATPGQPVHAYAHFRNVPRQFTLENRRLPLALPQSSGELRNLSRFDDSLCDTLRRSAIGNSRKLVQKLWRTGLACGKRRKTENKIHILEETVFRNSITFTPLNFMATLPWIVYLQDKGHGEQPRLDIIRICHPERNEGSRFLPAQQRTPRRPTPRSPASREMTNMVSP
jgi:hypothetical protein